MRSEPPAASSCILSPAASYRNRFGSLTSFLALDQVIAAASPLSLRPHHSTHPTCAGFQQTVPALPQQRCRRTSRAAATDRDHHVATELHHGAHLFCSLNPAIFVARALAGVQEVETDQIYNGLLLLAHGSGNKAEARITQMNLQAHL